MNSPLHKYNDLLIHFNIQCLQAKFDSLITFLRSLSHDSVNNLPIVLALSETWLNESNKESFKIKGYQPIVSNFRRDNSSRGGVAVFVREEVSFRERPDLNTFIPKLFESVFITVSDLNLTIGVIYRSPTTDIVHIKTFLTQFQTTLNLLHKSRESFILLGDFNFDILEYSQEPHATDFVDTIFEHACIPLITKPTRIERSSATCLDNLITNKVFPNSQAGIFIEDVSDHFPVFYSIPNSRKNKEQHENSNPSFRRVFGEDNLRKINDPLSLLSWDTILEEHDPQIAINNFQHGVE